VGANSPTTCFKELTNVLYYYLFPLAKEYSFFNLFQYLTFRSGGALVTSMLICFVLGPRFIYWLKEKQGKGQPIREDGPEKHLLTKKGTPTMGGLMMLISLTISTILWTEITNSYVWVVLLITLGYGFLGFLDDYLKVSKRNTKGLQGRFKIVAQFIMAGAAALAIQYYTAPVQAQHLAVPFFKDVLINFGSFYLVFAMVVIVGASNAVNLTDGLDGLAIVPIMLVAGTFGFIAYVAGNAVYADYLQIHRVAGAGELAVFCAALIGAGLGFLWYNAPPAMVFMGDTGSLAFGGALGTIAVITKHEIVLALAGGLFVAEALSVIIQVVSFKTTGKRVFKMAPVHHHFEKMGWEEPTIVIRFWIITVILCLLALSTLKLR
jgi:phospho-N-acetylmuramoyl-pentapeptide-transferase